jgi:hypothetical protein
VRCSSFLFFFLSFLLFLLIGIALPVELSYIVGATAGPVNSP